MSFFLETLKRNNGRFRSEGYAIGRGARCRDATRTRSSYRSFAPPVVFRRWRRRERKGKWPTDSFPLSWPSRAHTHIPAAKNFSHSRFLRVPRVYRVNERILSLQLFPPTCGKHFSSIFFSPFFSFFFFSEPRIQEILDFRHRITAENSDRFISTLVSVYKTWIFLAAINWTGRNNIRR